MLFRMNRANSAFTEQRQRFFFVLSGALVVALTLAAQSSQPGQKAANPAMPPSAVPQANDQTHLPIVRQQNSVNTERKRQLNEDSARLLKLANDLKVEVDKTNKDVLSMTVIRKADEIERLAHGVKEKMKLTVGDN